MGKHVWDLGRWKAVRLENGIAFDDLSGESFYYTLADEQDFQEIPPSIYKAIITNLTNYYESNMRADEWMKEINAELLPYGI
ncbi:UNVERIFIED_CONTAM: hypothetical protein N8J90_14965 [Halobacillus marinus]|uniref:hypothetical protein n=1 Tax=Bacillaceae TaxID=186817 RepID=UPI0002A4F6CE|nr:MULTISPECIES: hypothetical protein [Bacillaceae]ELK48492.1 hypothetical protein D479_02702 [Halobacillus sp. BAB-2008]QHT47874.1 hypothetical protein M662_15750 [Bacillus sp. SB49]